MGAAHRLGEVLTEAVQVRRDLGYPIMVTPFSQFVVSQATLNVLLGERYAEVTDEVIQYALGLYGREAAADVDAAARGRILGRSRAEELAHLAPADPMLAELRTSLGGPGLSDDELLLRYIMGGEREIALMRAPQETRAGCTARLPLVEMIARLAEQERFRTVVVAKGDFCLQLRRAPG